jgi:Zn finger protein HypA/HybF involved in hydrogenase expression
MSEEKYLRPKEIYQRVRCMNCQTRINVELGQKEVYCPQCGTGWKVYWVTPDLPMVLRRISPAYWPSKEWK